MHMMVYFETSMVEEARFIEVFLQVYCGQVRLLQRDHELRILDCERWKR